jgi:hypothetical protein
VGRKNDNIGLGQVCCPCLCECCLCQIARSFFFSSSGCASRSKLTESQQSAMRIGDSDDAEREREEGYFKASGVMVDVGSTLRCERLNNKHGLFVCGDCVDVMS